MCGKRKYRDEIAAKLALATIARKDRSGRHGHEAKECRYYKCPTGNHYHLTSQATPPNKEKAHA